MTSDELQREWPLQRRERCLRRQRSLQDFRGRPHDDLVRRVNEEGRLCAFELGEVLIEQGTTGCDVFFLLCGEVEVLVYGQQIGFRRGDTHVGEMAAINPTATRSATVRATQQVVSVVLTCEQVEAIGEDYPSLWRGFAIELAQRLSDRGKEVKRFLDMQKEYRNNSEVDFSYRENADWEGHLPPSVILEIQREMWEEDTDGDARDIFIGPLSPQIRSSMPRKKSPKDQLISDLNWLNQHPIPISGESALEIWLRNASNRTSIPSRKQVLNNAAESMRLIRERRLK